jgi:hypothetical protein
VVVRDRMSRLNIIGTFSYFRETESDRQMGCALLDLSRNGRIKSMFVRYDENRRNIVPEDISKELSRKPAPAQ